MSEDARKEYRELLLTTPGIEEHLSASYFLSRECTRELRGTTFPQVLKLKNKLPAVSLDAECEKNFPTY